MKALTKPSPSLFTALALLLLLSACDTNYWWSRGQPPSVSTMLGHSRQKLTLARKTFGEKRTEVSELSRSLEAALAKAVQSSEEGVSPNQIHSQLLEIRKTFINLEGKVSVGSRAPYAELSSQLRSFVSKSSSGDAPAYPALGLFAARTMAFLASELSVPPPSFQ